MSEPIRVIQFGLGPIGCAAARLVLQRENLELVGCVDVDPGKVGQDAGPLLGLERELGLPVRATIREALSERPADVALHTTNSYFDQFQPQVLEIVAAGLDIVSTSEELSFPWRDHASEAQVVDQAARDAGRTVLGTGLNPGFLMDSLPLNLTALAQEVTGVEVRRCINASLRRGPFQKKIGAGMDEPTFRQKMAAGRMGHVGLPESMAMLFDTLGRELKRYDDTVEPLVAAREHRTEHITVKPGDVRGLEQVARGFDANGLFATLTFVAGLDLEEDGDCIEIHGHPELKIDLHGTNGDVTTAAIVVNAIERTRAAAPGLVTIRDLPIVHA